MAGELDNLTGAVNKTVGIEESAVTLLQQLSAQIAANANDPAKIQALADELNAKADVLAAAITSIPAPTPAPPVA